MSRIAYSLSVTLLAGLSMVGCFHQSANYCPGVLNDNCQNLDASIDGPQHCTSNQQCMAPGLAICDITASMTCVQCTTAMPAACTGVTPVCGGDDACRACTAHAQCTSAACLPNGACGDDTNVAYVAPAPAGTDNMFCTKEMPCTTVAKALATARPFVKFTGTTDEPVTLQSGRAVTFLADPGALLTRGSGGAILTVRDDNTSLTIYDLSISNAPNNVNGFGLVMSPGGAPTVALTRVTLDNDPGGGVSAGGGTLTINKSKITNNNGGGILATGGTLTVAQSTVAVNRGGGISASGANLTFDITNTFVFRNGDDSTSMFGGLNIGITAAGVNRLAFNTIVDNHALIGSGGVICGLTTFMAPNNIVARNSLAGSTTNASAQVTAGGCTFPTSTIQPDLTGLAFVHPEVPGPFNYQLMAGSTAIDQATTPVPIDIDNKGVTRPQGPAKDIGADEYKPQ